ncbi:hypothetical protein KEM55_008634 [Ascosphaera atra]|nr:hypothetical protein KEM55_008634 [Ascosphaera atra]
MPTSIYFLTNRWYGLARMRRTQERVNKRYYAHRSDPYPNDTIIYYPGVPRGDIRAIERHQHPCAPGWNLRLACCGSRMMKLVRKSDANPPMVAAARDTLVRLIREQGLGGDGEWTRFRHGLGMKPDLTFHSTVDDSWGVILGWDGG